MANLLVRGVDQSLVQALRERAALHGRSSEAEHREIIATVLRRPKKRSFAEALMSIPDVGDDRDFIRANDADDANETPRVLD